MCRRGCAACLQDEFTAAIRALDMPFSFHIEEHARMSKRPIAAIACDLLAIDLYSLELFHVS